MGLNNVFGKSKATSLYSSTFGQEYDIVRYVHDNMEKILLVAQYVGEVSDTGDIIIDGVSVKAEWQYILDNFGPLETAVAAIQATISQLQADGLATQTYAESVDAALRAIIQTESDARATETDALATRTTTLEASVNDPVSGLAAAHAGIVNEATVRATENSALASDVTALTARVTTAEGDISATEAAVLNEQTARANADSALATSLTALDARVSLAEGDISSVEASVVAESGARASADSALAFDISSLTARMVTAETDIVAAEANIFTEQAARVSADNALATTITNVNTRVDANEAAITAESIARADGDSALAANITTLTATVDSNTAAISSETAARATADSALASDITTLTARVTTAEGDITSTQATIANESTVRADADSALALQISLLTAGVEGGFDPKYVWYFDNSDDGFTASGGTISVANGHLVLDSTGPSYIQKILSPGISGGQYPVLRARLKRTSGAGFDGSVHYQVDGGSFVDSGLDLSGNNPAIGEYSTFECDLIGVTNFASNTLVGIRIYLGVDATDDFEIDWVGIGRNGPAASSASVAEEATARAEADNALASSITALTARVTTAEGDIDATEASIISEQTARANADSALASDITTLTARVTTAESDIAAAEASITTEATVRADADTALSTLITSLDSRVGANEASIVSEQATRATADTALAQDITNLDARVTTAEGDIVTTQASIANESVARANADAAEASARQSLEAVVNTKNRVFRQPTPPTAIAVGDLWYDTDDNNILRIWDGTAWQLTTDLRIDQNAAAIVSEQTARADADSAIASDVTALTARVTTAEGDIDATEASIVSEQTARASADSALASDITTLAARVTTAESDIAAAEASISTEATARASGDTALSSLITALDSRVGANEASIVSEQTTRADADSALAQDVTNLDARLTTAEGDIVTTQASISSESTARVAGDAAEAAARQSLEAVVNTKNRVFRQPTQPTAIAVGDLWYDTDDNNTVRIWDGTAWQIASDLRIDQNAAAIVSEQTARANADSAIASDVTALTARVTLTESDIIDTQAALINEETVRADADTALASEITTLESRVSTTETGLSTAQANLASESATRAAADTAEANARLALQAVVNTKNRVFRQPFTPTAVAVGDIWFDTDDNNTTRVWDGTNWQITADLRIDENIAAIAAEQTARADADSAIAADVTTLSARVTTTEGDISDVQAALTAESFARADGDAAETVARQALESVVNTKNRVFRQTTQPIADSVGDLWYDTDDNNRLRVWTGTTWELTTDLRIEQNAAAITAEQTARANADSAIAADVTTLTARVTTTETDIVDVQAALTAESFARADGDAAETSARQALEAVVNTKNRVFRQTTQPIATAAGDLWYDTDDNNRLRVWSGTAWQLTTDLRIDQNTAAIVTEQTARADADSAIAADVTTLSARVDTAEAAIVTEQTARADGDSANATAISNLTTNVNGNTASIATVQSSVNGLQAKYGVTLNVNGHITGFAQNNNGQAGDFIVTADKFQIVAPGGGTAQAPFTVEAGSVKINGNLIVSGSISTGAIAAGAVSGANSSFTEAAIGLGVPWVAVQSCALTTTTGSRVRVDFAGAFYHTNSNGGDLAFRVKRNGTVIHSGILAILPIGDTIIIQDSETFQTIGTADIAAIISGNQSLFFMDNSPPAGNNTYTVELSGAGTIQSRQMALLELKR